MKHIRNSLVFFAGVLVITAVVTAFIPSRTTGMSNDVPKNAFSIATAFQNHRLLFGPDPEGTSYAITSFTVTNDTADPVLATINVLRGASSDCMSGTSQTPGPSVRLGAAETVHLSFPQPFVFSAESSASCLRLIGSANDSISVSVVGFKF